jgi:hypothetical protein
LAQVRFFHLQLLLRFDTNLILHRSAYIVVQITPFLADIGNTASHKGPFAEFWIFAAVCVFPLSASALTCCRLILSRCALAIGWVIAAVPETKDRTLEEIEAILVKGYRTSEAASSSGLLLNVGQKI